MSIDPVITFTLRVCFALLFTGAAYHKLRDPLAFRDTLGRYELLPARLVGPVGVTLMATEMVLAVAVLFLPLAGAVAALVLSLYAVAIAINLARGRTDLGCGCMGPAASAPISGWLVARNVVLVALAALLVVRTGPRPLAWLDALSVAGATLALTALWLASERMLALAPELARLRAARATRAGTVAVERRSAR